MLDHHNAAVIGAIPVTMVHNFVTPLAIHVNKLVRILRRIKRDTFSASTHCLLFGVFQESAAIPFSLIARFHRKLANGGTLVLCQGLESV